MRKAAIEIVAVAAMIGTPVLAADMAVKAPAPLVAPYSFGGFYAGVNLGYGVARDPSTVVSSNPPGTAPFQDDAFKMSPAGVLGGGQIGYNWQPSNWLFGLEADIQGTGQSDTACLIYCQPGVVGYALQQKLRPTRKSLLSSCTAK